jgi:hypothetical protein
VPENFQTVSTTQYGAYCRQLQASTQQGGSMLERDEFLLTDLRCQKYDHPFRAQIWQTLHYVAGSNEIVLKTTPKGALDDVRCPECGSLVKDPNDYRAAQPPPTPASCTHAVLGCWWHI